MGKFESQYDHAKIIEITKIVPVYVLLEIGKAICFTDYAVRFYKNKNHPKFHSNRALLEKAIRRAYTIGAFNHRERAESIIDSYFEEHFEEFTTKRAEIIQDMCDCFVSDMITINKRRSQT